MYSFVYRDQHRVNLLDTPGFDTKDNSYGEIAHSIRQWLVQERKQLSGIIFLTGISDARLEVFGLTLLAMSIMLCGPQAATSTVVATTFWNKVDPETGAEHERLMLEGEHSLGFVHARGTPILRHSGSRESALVLLEWALRDRHRLKAHPPNLLTPRKEAADMAVAQALSIGPSNLR